MLKGRYPMLNTTNLMMEHFPAESPLQRSNRIWEMITGITINTYFLNC